MKKILIIFICTFFITLNLSAQSEIKAKVDSIQQDVDRESFLTHTMEFNSLLAGIGDQKTTLKFYYISWQSHAEKDPHAMDTRLVKVELRYNIASSVDYTQEYIFNREEKLMYYMYKEEDNYEPDNSQILYYYYDNGGLVLLERVIVENSKGKKTEKLDFDDEEAGRVDMINFKAIAYLEAFKDMLDVEQLK
jgi:hypothetical protein